jgi:hypothetical protein
MIRSLTPPQAAGNALAFAVHPFGLDMFLLARSTCPETETVAFNLKPHNAGSRP